MTLKEKFKQWLDTDPRLQIREVQLEVIAEEFAIGFAEWILDWPEDWHRIEELLEIYKKEKGL
jgi:hypothetical protein